MGTPLLYREGKGRQSMEHPKDWDQVEILGYPASGGKVSSLKFETANIPTEMRGLQENVVESAGTFLGCGASLFEIDICEQTRLGGTEEISADERR